MSLSDRYNKLRPLIFLVTSGLLFLLAFVIFWLLPDAIPISQYKVPVLSFLSALIIASIGNIIIGFIQKSVNKETEIALEPSLKKLEDAVNKIRQMQFFYDEGVVGVYPNRAAAMKDFLGEIEREVKSIEFVGTSLLGSIDPHAENFNRVNFYDLLKLKSKSGVRIRALLMHPAYGEFRERVEGRVKGAVARDIQKTLKYFLGGQISFFDKSGIRLYPGVITAYAIFTTRSMLVNVSTLHGPVYPNLTMVIRDTVNENSLFKRFKEEHFEEPWKGDLAVRFDIPNGQALLDKLLEADFSVEESRFKEGDWSSTINPRLHYGANQALQPTATVSAEL